MTDSAHGIQERTPAPDRARRWRLILGAEAEEGAGGQAGGADGAGSGMALSGQDRAIDAALAALYDEGDGQPRAGANRQGGLGGSAPNVARWLDDIRRYFPSPVVRVMQQDAVQRLNLHRLLLEPELLSAVEPDVRLVTTLISLGNVLPAKSRETARLVVRRVVEDLERRLASPLRQAVRGSLNRASRTNRPRHHEIDWHRTIRANLKHYQPEHRTVIPERRIGYGRRRGALRDIILCLDQSGSMAASVVYAGVFGAVLASLPSVSTRVVAFDTAVVDLSDSLDDPVDLLFGVQLGGGTDINRALTYCHNLVRRPRETILVLVSDLYEGGNREAMLRRVAALVADGVQVIALLALSDQGAPGYDRQMAATYAGLGVPAFACTPDLFPDLMATAISRGDISQWAARQGIVTARAD